MNRLLVLAGLAAALAAVGAQPAVTGGDAHGPGCVDITNGSISYASTGTLTADVYLAKPACARVTYTASVYDPGGQQLLSSITYAPCAPEVSGGGCVAFSLDLTSGGATAAPPVVCVTASTTHGSRVTDRAPDAPDVSCQTPVPTAAVSIDGPSPQPFQ
jgi:hypothetical protein